jgi:hypothetical protein
LGQCRKCRKEPTYADRSLRDGFAAYSQHWEGEAVNRADALDKTLREMYEVISFPEGGEPDWERMKTVFHAKARFTRITPEGTDHLDLQSFQDMAMEMLDRGVYTSFFEQETARKAHIFGSLAHVLSAYETKRDPEASSCLSRGVNSIQLLWESGSWQVLSLLWDEAVPGNPLSIDQLFTSEVSCGEGA